MIEPDKLKRILVDARNIDEWIEPLVAMMRSEADTGIDLETHNENAHEGIKAYKDDDVFDVNRTTITGLSVYVDGQSAAFYFNLNQADEENRLPFHIVQRILESHSKGLWIAHNAVFERTMLLATYKWHLPDDRTVDTLQMAVSAYNQDQYDPTLLRTVGISAFEPVLGRASVEFSTFADRQHMTSGQSEVLGQVIGKSSKAAFSYNGLVKSIAYGYSLKQAVLSHFGYRMTTYKEALGIHDHMGQLTGAEVVSYGADDSYWAVRLFHKLRDIMLAENPLVLKTFLEQENTMIPVYSDVWLNGIRINTANVRSQQAAERISYATKLAELKRLMRAELPFKSEPHEGLSSDDKFYAKSYKKYRDRIVKWCNTKDEGLSEYEIVKQISGPVSKSWTADNGEIKESDLNLEYYMTQRVIMYDLFGQKCIKYKGKVQSDGEARGKLMERLEGNQLAIMRVLGEMVGIAQSMKLYLNPYLMLIDPDTNRIYPQLSSQLNTRRMAMSFPNAMQLSKRSSTYVRGFYLPDEDDQVIVSLDWSSIELVVIGELSGDPEFARVFGQLPFGDLHTGAALDVLKVTIPELTLDIFNSLDQMSVKDINKINPKILIKPNGDALEPSKAKKYWRVEVGKTSNFGFWYSGALSDTAERMGWSSDTMWKATEAYRERFSVAEKWRTDTINQLQLQGYLELPDHHRRVRFEATPEFGAFFNNQFRTREGLLGLPHKGLSTFGNIVTRSIQSRANNQGINALVQGTNAAIAKRSIQAVLKGIKEQGIRARFLFSVHDELVWTVHKDDAVKLIHLAKKAMTDHPDIFKTLKLDCTASVGRTFEPWDDKKAPIGQIECDEMPEGILDFKRGAKLSGDDIERCIQEYLFGE